MCLLHSALTDLCIDLTRPPRTVDYRARLPELTTLTSIDLNITAEDTWAPAVVRANAAHLRSLVLCSPARVCAPLAAVFDLALPSLTRLILDHKALASPLPAAAFLARHAAQLTRFSALNGAAPAATLESLRRGDFRLLRKLGLGCDAARCQPLRQAIAALDPSLTSISLRLDGECTEWQAIIAAAGTRLRKLHFSFATVNPESMRNTLRACTRLRSVLMSEPLIRSAAAAGCPLVSIGGQSIGPADLRSFTSLREMDLGTSTPMRSEFIPPSLPALRKLCMHLKRPVDAVAVVRRLLHVAPRLASLELSFDSEWIDTDLKAMCDVCSVAAPSVATLWMYVRLTQADIDAVVAPALPRSGWLSVHVASNFC